MARSLRHLRARGRLCGGAIVLAPRHCYLWHRSGAGEEPIGLDGTAMGQCLPRTAEFRFDLANTMVMAAPDGAIAIAIAPWTSTGFHEDGTAFDRPGRATIVLVRQPDGRWLGVHSHMSLARGVPQDSHGKRAVKAR